MTNCVEQLHSATFSSAQTRVPSLDGLRAISAGMVVVSHLLSHSPHLAQISGDAARRWVAGPQARMIGEMVKSLFYVGNLGVQIFFVISGFIISTLLIREKSNTGSVNLRRFYFRRFFRIFPPYYFFLLFVGAMVLLDWLPISPLKLFASALYLSNYIPSGEWYLGHTWSLSVEEQFYLLWPGLFVLLSLQRLTQVASSVILLVPLVRLAYHNFDIGSYYQFEAIADALAFGCLLACRRDWLHTQGWYLFLMRAPVIAVLIGVLYALELLSVRPSLLPSALYVLFGMSFKFLSIALAIDYFVSFAKGKAFAALNAPVLVALGQMSYTIYLWQQLFTTPYVKDEAAYWPVKIALLLIVSWIAYRLVERPMLNWRQQLEVRFV
jgi:peptidoglycan/LPS O-acetylase OafA/YrhL